WTSMPLFTRRSKASAAGTPSSPTAANKKTMAAVPSRKERMSMAEAFAGDDSLTQLHAETQELLRLVKTPAPKKAARSVDKPVAKSLPRMTIEVLDDDDDSNEQNADKRAFMATTRPQGRPTSAGRPPSSAGASKDTFAFDVEENRVRRGADTFYPDTSPTKAGMGTQVHALTSERKRLVNIELSDVAVAQRHQHERNVYDIHDRVDTSAIKVLTLTPSTSPIQIQAHSRGFLCRKRLRDEHRKKDEELIRAQWHQVRDVERGETWYYNAHTGHSQWNPPPHFLESRDRVVTLPPPSELPTIGQAQGSISKGGVLPRLGVAANSSDLPPLSPTSASRPTSAGSASARSTSTGAQPQSRTPKRQSQSVSAASLPALHPDYVVSAANPWECDSVHGTDSDSLCSERIEDDEEVDVSDDPFARRRSMAHADEAPNQSESTANSQAPRRDDGDNGDWDVNDTLFLADGSRNSRLRDTIRNALQVSKFDSISSLIASNVVLRKKRSSKKRYQPGSPSEIAHNHLSANQRAGGGREVVLGRRDAPFMVAMLASEKDKEMAPSPTVKSGKSSSKRHLKMNLPPRIRDVTDPGFQDDSHQVGVEINSPVEHISAAEAVAESPDTKASVSPSKSKSVPVCFNCWSSSKGKHCENHRDPNDHRKVRSADSALMCANWELDQLRRKYRAEEIQEIFMKQNASLRYDKRLKAYVTVVECKHPIYRVVNQLSTSWNKTMRRKIHTRAWFRSFMEQLRAGRVPKADKSTPGLLKLKDTIQNNKWCTRYSDSVREFHPKAPVTSKNHSGQKQPILDVIMVHPAHPQLPNWVLKTDLCKPIELYRPHVYEVPPRRCVPMPTPSFLEDIPLPVPNIYIESDHVASWMERLCARIASASLNKALLQIQACSPPPGVTDARRTKHVMPVTVMFATFGRKPTKGNLAVGGLSAELLIHMLVTTYVPAQFGNFVVFDRRAIAPLLTKDHDAIYACLIIDPTTLAYVFRALEHALNVRRPPSIVLAARITALETEEEARINKRFPLNRPEQTGEEDPCGFRTFWLVDFFVVNDVVPNVEVRPNSSVLSPNITSMNPTSTTKVDRFYPFAVPTTKENTPVEYIHLLWIGQSSRNQPQLFTTLGAQQPGDFMKNSNPLGALGVCTSVIYRSWAYMQSSPFEEFVTDDGLAYWYDKRTCETFWSRPILPIEQHRGKDGDIDGVVCDGAGEHATLGVGAEEPRYSLQSVRKYMTKSIEAPEEREKRLKHVTASARKHDIVISLSDNDGAAPKKSNELERIRVPKLKFTRKSSAKTRTGATTAASNTVAGSPQKTHGHMHTHTAVDTAQSANVQTLDVNTQQIIQSITQALGNTLKAGNQSGQAVDMLQLGIGLGMGLGLRSQVPQQPSGRPQTTPKSSHRVSFRPGTLLEGEEGDEHDGGEDDEEEGENGESDMDDEASDTSSLTARSEMSVATSVDVSPSPDEVEMGADTGGVKRAGYGEKKPGYQTHPPPGEGRTWVKKPVDASADSQTAVPGLGGSVHQRVARLPQDFVEAVTATKTCKMQANYLPVVKNLNAPRSVGIVRPRKAYDEWIPIGFSPWNAGRAVFGMQFINNLMARPEIQDQLKAGALAAPGGDKGKRASVATIETKENVTQAVKEQQQLDTVISLTRHGKYDEVETMIQSPDWTISIDAKDAMGNTLLSVACQNNNKRIAKLCLRRGADINTQNLNGQTVLHYCHEYGFHDLMQYLMDKGARDDITNADGLTCYEGLSKEAVDAL
ncbi:TPA: hypothetical protein N0F65_010028, partial [Lagenidium giganteum]